MAVIALGLLIGAVAIGGMVAAATSSQTAIQQNTQMNTAITNTLNQTTNSIHASSKVVSTNKQKLTIINGAQYNPQGTMYFQGKFECGASWNVNQSLNSKSKAIISVLQNNKSEFTNNVVAKLYNKNIQTTKQTFPLIHFGAQHAEEINKQKDTVIHNLKNIVSNAIDSSVKDLDTNTNTLSVINYGIIQGDQCNINQDMVTSAIASNITRQIINTIFKNTDDTTSTNSSKQKITQIAGGIPIWVWIIIGVVVLGIIGYFGYKGYKKKQQGNQQQGNQQQGNQKQGYQKLSNQKQNNSQIIPINKFAFSKNKKRNSKSKKRNSKSKKRNSKSKKRNSKSKKRNSKSKKRNSKSKK